MHGAKLNLPDAEPAQPQNYSAKEEELIAARAAERMKEGRGKDG